MQSSNAITLQVTSDWLERAREAAGSYNAERTHGALVDAINLAIEAQRQRWVDFARCLGEEAGERAASWTCDGNTDVEQSRKVARMLADGDPAADDYLPQRPNLSGEWADAPTSASLAQVITGRGWSQLEDGELTDALATAWEEGVDATFGPACERELRKHAGMVDGPDAVIALLGGQLAQALDELGTVALGNSEPDDLADGAQQLLERVEREQREAGWTQDQD